MGDYTAIFGEMTLTREAAKHLIVDGKPDWGRLGEMRAIRRHPHVESLRRLWRYTSIGYMGSSYHELKDYGEFFDAYDLPPLDQNIYDFIQYSPSSRRLVFFSSIKNYGGLIETFISVAPLICETFTLSKRFEDEEKVHVTEGHPYRRPSSRIMGNLFISKFCTHHNPY